MSDASQSSWIQTTTDATFDIVVMEQSRQVPVVVDFWAEWCGPCRALAPTLERLAQEYEGRFVLVKANTDENQAAANQFRVSGIPAVYAVSNAEVLDSFQGALPEDAVRQWLDNVIRRNELVQLKMLMATDPAQAEVALRKMVSEDPNNWDAVLALAGALADLEQPDESAQLIERLESRGFLEPEAEAIKASLALKSTASLDIETLKKQLVASPNDLSIKFQLAQALAGHKHYQPALDLCLELVEADRKGLGEQGRELMLQVFRVLPNGDELTTEYRRKLSMALY